MKEIMKTMWKENLIKAKSKKLKTVYLKKEKLWEQTLMQTLTPNLHVERLNIFSKARTNELLLCLNGVPFLLKPVHTSECALK